MKCFICNEKIKAIDSIGHLSKERNGLIETYPCHLACVFKRNKVKLKKKYE